MPPKSLFFEDPATRRAFLDCVKLGMPIVDCCAYSGVPESTYHDAMEMARRAIGDGRDSKYVEFSEAVARARGEFVRNNLAIIQAAAVKKDWKASAWLLERRRPKDYGPTQNATPEPQAITIVNDVPKR